MSNELHEYPKTDTLDQAVCQYERKIIKKALQKHKYNRTEVAVILGMNRKTLYNKIKKHNL